jgi:hypothetical protein
MSGRNAWRAFSHVALALSKRVSVPAACGTGRPGPPASMLCSGPMNSKPLAMTAAAIRGRGARVLRGESGPWPVWWLLGPVILAAATWLALTAESFRYEEAHFWGALLDTLKLLLCLFWLTLAWRTAADVRHRFWRLAARCAIAAGLVIVGLTY